MHIYTLYLHIYVLYVTENVVTQEVHIERILVGYTYIFVYTRTHTYIYIYTYVVENVKIHMPSLKKCIYVCMYVRLTIMRFISTSLSHDLLSDDIHTYSYIHLCMYIYDTHTYFYIHLYMYIYVVENVITQEVPLERIMCRYACIFIYTHIFIYVYIYICICICIIYGCIHMYMYMYICVYRYVYIYIHM